MGPGFRGDSCRKSARRPSKLRTKLLLRPPHSSTQNLCFDPYKMFENYLFRTQLFSPKRPPRTTTVFKTIFLALKMVQQHPPKLWKKGLQDAETYDKSGGRNAAEPRRNRRNHVRTIFRTIFMTMFRTVSEKCGENRLKNRGLFGDPFGGCFGTPKSHCFFAVGFQLPCLNGPLCSAQTSE